MSLDITTAPESTLTPELKKEEQEAPKRLPRAKLIEAGQIVLTKKLTFGTSIKLRTGVILGKFKKINNQNSWEHLPEEERKDFKETIDIDTLPVGGFVEVWTQRPGHEEYQVTEYKKMM